MGSIREKRMSWGASFCSSHVVLEAQVGQPRGDILTVPFIIIVQYRGGRPRREVKTRKSSANEWLFLKLLEAVLSSRVYVKS